VPNFLPSGLQIVDGKPQGELVRQPLSGCVIVRSGDAQLISSMEFADTATVTDAIQMQPDLCDGRPGDADRRGRAAETRGTFVLTDQAGRWAIGTCKNVALQGAGGCSRHAGHHQGVPVKRALRSRWWSFHATALWWKDGPSGVARITTRKNGL